jgi:cobalt/nickel transport system ATP-binding protein
MIGTAFDFRNASFSYQAHAALKGISFAVNLGERVALLGANGSGKSTLLRLMDALSFADGGTATALGQPLSAEAMQSDEANFALRRRIGLVFQNPDVQLFNPTVTDELAFGPLQLGWDKAQIRAAIDESLQRFGLAQLKDRPPHRLSGGEKKRVAIASVLITKPDILLLDEPTAALDPKSRSDLVAFLSSELPQGQTVITATHDLDIVEHISSRAIVLDAGTIAADGSTLSIIHDAALLQRTHLVHAHHHTHSRHAAHAHGHIHIHAQDQAAPNFTLKQNEPLGS